MTRRFVNQLGERENIDEIYLAAEKQLRTNRNGNLYMQVRLADKTGSMTGMLWNANDSHYNGFENGDYVRVRGTAQFYNGSLQVILAQIERVPAERITPDDFITLDESDVTQLQANLQELLRTIRNPSLRVLADAYLADSEFMAKFTSAPAGVKNHHAYRGGLLQHVVSLMRMCRLAASHYSEVDGDLLLMGALLHDSGKVDELTYERDLGYSDEGQLIGHVVQGVVMLEEKIREAERSTGDEFPTELALRLKHMIVSHHGEYEFGSPKLPMTLEAITLHYLDDLDAKLFSIGQIIREDQNSDSPWTPYFASMGRKFFKGN
jgi:3'-5' exoribonuclease